MAFYDYLMDALDQALDDHLPTSMTEAVDWLGGPGRGGGVGRLADGLGVSERTVQRWLNYEAGSGKQSRNPEDSLDDMRDLDAIRQIAAENVIEDNRDADLDIAVEGEFRVSNEKNGRSRPGFTSNMSPDDLAEFWDQVKPGDIASNELTENAVTAFENATMYGYNIHQHGEWTEIESVDGLRFQ